MPIQVTCPGCRTRFSVSEKFAGQQGPCPKCKTVLTIPTAKEEVVIHAPEQFGGAKDATGKLVLKPIARSHLDVQPTTVAIIVAAAVTVLLVAVILRFGVKDKEKFPLAILAVGAAGLAGPLALGGYIFLRDDELEPYRGLALGLRVAACAVVYALLWAASGVMNANLFDGSPELWHLVFLVPGLVAVGATAAYASLDLEFGTAALHYGLYLLVTVVLRMIVGLPPL